jgi:hypothetical protein
MLTTQGLMNYFAGACDGTGDNTIKHLYVPNDHWRGVFVEPLTMNVRDLIKYMSEKQASQRSFIIHAAATSVCHKPTLVMERPLYEEKNASIPVSQVKHQSPINTTCYSFIDNACFIIMHTTALAASPNRVTATRKARSCSQGLDDRGGALRHCKGHSLRLVQPSTGQCCQGGGRGQS